MVGSSPGIGRPPRGHYTASNPKLPAVQCLIIRIVDIGCVGQEGLRQTGRAGAAIKWRASVGVGRVSVVESCRRVSTAGDRGEPAGVERVEQLSDDPLQSGLVG